MTDAQRDALLWAVTKALWVVLKGLSGGMNVIVARAHLRGAIVDADPDNTHNQDLYLRADEFSNEPKRFLSRGES